jgi:hypothetical protein
MIIYKSGRYFPSNLGFRFSAKAANPSNLSELPNNESYTFLSKSNPCSRGVVVAPSIASFAALNASGADDQYSLRIDPDGQARTYRT